jgi:hypothetical protein
VLAVPNDQLSGLLDLVVSLDSKPAMRESVEHFNEGLCALLRLKAVSMFVNNMEDWGYLLPLVPEPE